MGYGSNNADKQFERNISECNRLGIPCGVYWFSYALSAQKAANEAKYCLAAIKPYKVEYPVCFDFEYDSVEYAEKCGVNVTKELASSMVRAFCGTVEGVKYYAMNYSNPDFLSRYFDVEIPERYDLWLASWKSNPNFNDPPRQCGIWQYGTRPISGIIGNVDANVSYKDYKQIIAEWGLNNLYSSQGQPSNVPSDWAAAAWEWAKTEGILDGTNPHEPMTREMGATMLMRFAEKYNII